MQIKLWTINRWLRWTGFRFAIYVENEAPTLLEVRWYGLYGSKGWDRIEGSAGNDV